MRQRSKDTKVHKGHGFACNIQNYANTIIFCYSASVLGSITPFLYIRSCPTHITPFSVLYLQAMPNLCDHIHKMGTQIGLLPVKCLKRKEKKRKRRHSRTDPCASVQQNFNYCMYATKLTFRFIFYSSEKSHHLLGTLES